MKTSILSVIAATALLASSATPKVTQASLRVDGLQDSLNLPTFQAPASTPLDNAGICINLPWGGVYCF